MPGQKKRFRASIYLDVFVDVGEVYDLETMRDQAEQEVERIVDILSLPSEHSIEVINEINFNNPYIGGVATIDEIMTGKKDI